MLHYIIASVDYYSHGQKQHAGCVIVDIMVVVRKLAIRVFLPIHDCGIYYWT